MKRRCTFLASLSALLLAAVAMGGAAGAQAADITSLMGGKNNAKPEAPSDQMPPLPKPETPAPQVQEVKIPDLPPSLPCKAEWLYGLWLLQEVYESPVGKESATYNVNPKQYIGFSRDTRFYRYNGGKTEMDPHTLFKTLRHHTGVLLQFLLQDAGMLYLYQDGVANDTQVCFIVAETRPPFAAGNMLLMPPKGQIQGRLIKVYKKMWPPKQQIQPKQNQRFIQRPTVRHYVPR